MKPISRSYGYAFSITMMISDDTETIAVRSTYRKKTITTCKHRILRSVGALYCHNRTHRHNDVFFYY